MRGESVEVPSQNLIAVPVLSGLKAAAVFVLRDGEASPHAASLLTAVATLAGAGFSTGRQQRALAIEKALLAEVRGACSAIIGDSPAVHQLLHLISRVAPRETTVLIHGETGTGKELVARAIHDGSPRASQPFVPINCAALADSLLESELFGYEKGAFTGAGSRKPGKLELAQGGTVFLDEIGEMALSLQAKLLRVLQQRQMERVGGLHPIPLDVRFLAATNRDLGQEVAAGRFREDLYHRLNVVSLRTPPLRERREDILLLASHFLRRATRRVSGISPEAARALCAYHWPGNIRELENALERAIVLGDSERIELEGKRTVPTALTEVLENRVKK
jgi:transcriptional regulator with GAF, ATPase, and Fis domain